MFTFSVFQAITQKEKSLQLQSRKGCLTRLVLAKDMNSRNPENGLGSKSLSCENTWLCLSVRHQNSSITFCQVIWVFYITCVNGDVYSDSDSAEIYTRAWLKQVENPTEFERLCV